MTRAVEASTTQPAKPSQADDHERLARHLSEHVRGMLAGDAPDRKMIEQRRPSRVLQLGVLPPQQPPEEGRSSEELARRLGEPPSVMGFDFLIRPPESGVVQVELAADFSVYVQRYPTFVEQREWWDPDRAAEDDDEHSTPDSGRMRLKGKFERHDVNTNRHRLELTREAAPERLEVDLGVEIRENVGRVLMEPATVYPFRGSQTLPEDALQSQEAWRAAIEKAEGEARSASLEPQDARLVVTTRQGHDGLLHVRASLINCTIAQPTRRHPGSTNPASTLKRDLHLFNSRLRVYTADGDLTPTRFAQAPEDFRYSHLRTAWAIGHNCVARRLSSAEDSEQPLSTETWPLYRQTRLDSRSDPSLELEFAVLARDGTYMAALRQVQAEMAAFEEEWRTALDTWPCATTLAACERALEDFRGDLRCFELGLRCLADDPRLARAFREANEVFRRHGASRRNPIVSWRLFQLVYLVIHMAGLRARESDEPELLAELDTVDVLWFPTGGGKTEAYLGLICCLLFYDRLRGKERGVSAVLRFPLRMLSVQQLQRVLAVLWFAESRRREINASESTMAGDPFALGYWVGAQNSPNSLTGKETWPRESVTWWHQFIETEPTEALKTRIVTQCPNPECDGGNVVLVADEAEVRLRHVCLTCNEELPVYVSDEEVYRYLPCILVCTVDKLAHVARADHFSNILAGPAYRCPKHGYFTWHQAVWGDGPTPTRDDRCLGGRYCSVEPERYEAVPATYDPCPAVQVQDELHLLQEELGTFNAHYETLLEELQRSFGTGKPSKLLAATATIEAYDSQVRQLYARQARVFPSPGWELDRSFYTQNRPEARRLYVGALPYRPDPAEFGEKVQELLHLEVGRLQDSPESSLVELNLTHRDQEWMTANLFLYELTLGYVNRKQDGDRIQGLLATLSKRKGLADSLDSIVLSGDVTLAEIADALERIEHENPGSCARADRLRAIIATSIVSHGVDISRLNLMVMNGMTPNTAGYIQATSRSGRSHVGLVVVGYDRRKARDLSFFQYFLKYHAFIDRLIAPVPVNRFAKFACRRTMPGLLSALLIQKFGRSRLDAMSPSPQKPTTKSLVRASELGRWWRSSDPPEDKREALTSAALRALGLTRRVLVLGETGDFHSEPVFDPGMVESLTEDAMDEIDAQLAFMQEFQRAPKTPKLFQPEPLTSFRDVDEPIDFAVTRDSESVEEELTRHIASRRS